MENLFYYALCKSVQFRSKNEEYLRSESSRILNSFITIYEFLDRGMKGFLTGDISYKLISDSVPILEKHIKELIIIENDFLECGIEPADFYNSFFKIDKTFFSNNSSLNLALNLSKSLEDSGEIQKRLMYYVNLKHTQFFDLFKTQMTKIMIKEGINNNKIDAQTIKTRINTEKEKVQQIFNDMYNELIEVGIINSLKTPFYGILYPEKENKHNFFRRQLLIEEHSFESANQDFNNIFTSLQKVDKAHELFFNRKMIIEWHQSLNYSIAECQKSIISNMNFNQKSDDFLKYFV